MTKSPKLVTMAVMCDAPAEAKTLVFCGGHFLNPNPHFLSSHFPFPISQYPNLNFPYLLILMDKDE